MGHTEEDGVLRLTDGMWFNDQGDHWLIREENFAEAKAEEIPSLSLGKRLKYILPHYPDIVSWISDNPPRGNTKLWWKQLMATCLVQGWNLAWQGAVYTTLGQVSAVRDAILKSRTAAQQLDWPLDSSITISVLNEETGRSDLLDALWSDLLETASGAS